MARYSIFHTKNELIEFIPQGTTNFIVIDNIRICLVHNKNGIFAFEDKCPHAGARFSEGKCNYLGEIVCPLHSYIFDPETGDGVSHQNLRLKKYYLELTEKEVYLHL